MSQAERILEELESFIACKLEYHQVLMKLRELRAKHTRPEGPCQGIDGGCVNSLVCNQAGKCCWPTEKQ